MNSPTGADAIHRALTGSLHRILIFGWLTGVMAELLPPPASSPADDERAARLAALSARRPSRPSPEPTRSSAGVDMEDRLAARFEALSARRGQNHGEPVATPGRSRSKRRHPAKGARVAALGLSLASTGGLATLFAVTNAQSGTETQAAQIVATTPAGGASAAAGSAASAAPSPAIDLAQPATPATPAAPAAPATTVPVASATVVDGGVFSNKWGVVQVQATFGSDGTLVDVAALQTPSRDGKSVRINDAAVPRLNSEALTAQSANVDTVSGATYTSNDYRRSLQSAIDAAAQAGLAVATA